MSSDCCVVLVFLVCMPSLQVAVLPGFGRTMRAGKERRTCRAASEAGAVACNWKLKAG